MSNTILVKWNPNCECSTDTLIFRVWLYLCKVYLCVMFIIAVRFSSDPAGLLVSSDVAARGLDILNVDHVIHYQVPQNADVSSRNRCLWVHVTFPI